MWNHNFGNLTGRFEQYVVDFFFVVDIIRIGGHDSLGSVQIVISPYDENANFSCPNKNYSWWTTKFDEFTSFMWNLLSLGRVRVSVKKAELGMGQKVLSGYELNELKVLRCGFCAFRQNITCGFILKIAETPDSGSDP